MFKNIQNQTAQVLIIAHCMKNI